MLKNCRHLLLALSWAMLGLQSPPAVAQADYPSRPIRFVLGTGAGGGADAVARLLAEKMSVVLKGTIVVENKTGAGGAIAAEYVAKAAPDGYTMLLGGLTSHVLLPAMNPRLSYDPIKDFTPIGSAATATILIIATKDFPANNLKELIALAQSKPGLQYASWGNGSTGHFCAELLNQRRQLRLDHIPYKTTAQIQNDILAGHIKLAYIDIATGAPLVQSNRVKAIGACTTRSPILPNVGAYDDEGIDVEGSRVSPPMQALYFPAKTPKAIVDKMAAALKTVVEMPEVKARFLELGNVAEFASGDELLTIIKADMPTWRKVARAANIVAD